MPVRQDVQGGIQAPAIADYRSPGVARAQLIGVDTSGIEAENNRQSAFWSNLAQRGAQAFQTMENRKRAEAYLEGQQDSQMGKERSQVHKNMQADYEQGYNRATVGSSLAKFQMDAQQKVVEFVNAGKTPDEFNAALKEQVNGLLDQAGAQGMDLKNEDWQAWLNGVNSTRNTVQDLFQTKQLERSQYMKAQSLAAEGNASISTFMSADEAGNPMQALDNFTAHVQRIYSDDTLSLQQKDGTFADFATQILANAKSSGAVEGVSAYVHGLPQFKSLPTQVQTQIVQNAQRQYEQRAADESGEVYTFASEVRSISDPNVLAQSYPMSSFISRLNEAVRTHKIAPSTMFSMVEEENTRRLKLQTAADKVRALQTGGTLSDISTMTGDTLGAVKTALIKTTAQQNGGYSGGGLSLMKRGLQSGAQDITSVGIEMLQQDAQSLASIDSRTLKRDADGEAQYPTTVVNSLQNLKTAYDTAMRAGNNVQAQQLISGLPDAVAYGIRQNVDANSMASVVYRRADDLAAGRVPALPAQMPKEMLANSADVSAGLFDTSLTQKGAARNILGIQSYIFTSSADEKAQQSRLALVNGAISEEYTSLYQQGKLPALEGDDLKNWLVGRVAGRTVRVDDGTDHGTLMILPNVPNKEALFGSVDNNLIAQGLKDSVDDFKAANPGAVQVQMRYDAIAGELVFSGVDKDNVLMTTAQGVSVDAVRNAVRAVEARITTGGKGNQVGALSIPGAGFVQFNSANSIGVDGNVYKKAVTQLISYEGYTDTKGFSVLATHPTTGAKLNDMKYVKQPGDSPQVATDKFSMYLQDNVLPQVANQMKQYSTLPEFLRQDVFSQLVDTTYHAGNAQAFGGIIDQIIAGDTPGAYKAFRESALYKDAGADSRRNQDRFNVMQAVSQYVAMHQR